MELTCTSCHKTFLVIDGERNYKTCKKCRTRNRISYRRYEQNQRIKRIEADIISNHLNEIVHEIEVYNKEHGTHYTYGKYVALKERGLIE